MIILHKGMQAHPRKKHTNPFFSSLHYYVSVCVFYLHNLFSLFRKILNLIVLILNVSYPWYTTNYIRTMNILMCVSNQFVTKAKEYIKDVADMSKQHATQTSSYHQQQQQQHQQSQQNTERYNLLSSSIDERSPQTVTSHVLKPLSVVFSYYFFFI